MLRRILSLAAIVIALTACGTTSVGRDYKPTASAEKGVVIVSVTRSRSENSYKGLTAHQSGITLFYTDLNTKERGSLRTDAPVSLLNSFSSGHLDGEDGRLFVIELPVGKYEFDSWSVVQGTYTQISPKTPFSIPFSVEPAIVKYLGEVNVDFFIGQSMVGSGAIADATVRVKNSRERDFAAVSKGYPNIPLDTVKVEILANPQPSKTAN